MLGDCIRATIFGQSHSQFIGVKIDGLPKGKAIDIDYIQEMLNRRKSGNNSYSTPRREEDKVVIKSGLYNGVTSGDTLEAVIENTNVKPQDYSNLLVTPRPSHADYVAKIKYGDSYTASGGGEFSGRMTAPMVIMGAIAKQIIAGYGIQVFAGVSGIGNIECGGYDMLDGKVNTHDFYAIDNNKSPDIQRLLEQTRAKGDSVGGSVQCAIIGMPTGVGGAMFDGLEGDIAKGLFGIPAVKGVEFGLGFDFAKSCGSKVNDELYYDGDLVKTYTNNNGGINGGISNGMPITIKVAVKPTPSISLPQKTVNLLDKTNTTLTIHGRHDSCIVPRAVVVVEAVTAFIILDRLIKEGR